MLLYAACVISLSIGLRAAPVGDCPKDQGEEQIFLPDSKIASIYYKCDWGIPVMMECPGGLYFDPVFDLCDFPENVYFVEY